MDRFRYYMVDGWRHPSISSKCRRHSLPYTVPTAPRFSDHPIQMYDNNMLQSLSDCLSNIEVHLWGSGIIVMAVVFGSTGINEVCTMTSYGFVYILACMYYDQQ